MNKHTSSAYIKKFTVDTSVLSAEERRVLEKLVAAAELAAPLYERQKNAKRTGANFYPADATREEIGAAAKKDPEILSPYTFVERKGKQLVAVPYSKKFAKELQQIAALLKEAASLTKDKPFKAYLNARADDLLKDNFDKSNALWLKTADSKVGFVIGPFDRFLDKHFHQKRAYTAWVGILNEKQTNEMQVFAKAMLAGERRYLPGAKQARAAELRVRLSETTCMAGLDADFSFVSNNLPSSADTGLIKKVGTMSTVFLPMLEWKFSAYINPIYENVFAGNTRKKYSQKELKLAMLRMSVIDELRRSLVRYDDATARLGEAFAYIDEVYGDISTIKSATYLYLKGLLQERDLEALLVAEICQALSYIAAVEKKNQYGFLVKGYVALLSFLLNGGALQKAAKGFSFDAQKTLIVIDQIEGVFDYYIALGTRKETKEFFEELDEEDVLKTFAQYLPTA